MNNEINLGYLIKILKNSWLKIAAITLAAVLVIALLTVFLLPKKYKSDTEFYILNSSDVGYTSSSVLSASDYLANDYISIITSDIMLGKVVDKLKAEGNTEYTIEDIRNMISSETKTTTSIFYISVETKDPKLTHSISSYIAEMAPDVISDVTTKDNAEGVAQPVKVLRFPVFSENHTSPSLIINVIVTFMLAAVISYIVFFLKDILDTTLRTEENVKEKIKYPLIGVIPEWKVSSDKKNTEV